MSVNDFAKTMILISTSELFFVNELLFYFLLVLVFYFEKIQVKTSIFFYDANPQHSLSP